MRKTNLLPLLISLALPGALISQQVHVTKTDPGKPAPVLKSGSTVVFDAPANGANKNYWILFHGVSPCKYMWYPGRANASPSCKILKNTTGGVATFSYEYVFSQPAVARTAPSTGHTGAVSRMNVVDCIACSQIQVGADGPPQ